MSAAPPFYTVDQAIAAGWPRGTQAEAFAQWMNQLNALVVQATGLTIDDFPDWDFANAYEDYDYVDQAALAFLEEVAYDLL